MDKENLFQEQGGTTKIFVQPIPYHYLHIPAVPVGD